MLVTGHQVRIRSDVEVANLSDIGCERSENEDYFIYIEPQDEEQFRRRGRLILVADGMGGQNGGEVASRLAAETIRDLFINARDEGDPRSVLIAGFRAAHRAILDMASESPELEGMGTTCCAVILEHGRMHYGHAGDSRIYLIRDGLAERLTEDHNVAARMVREGILDAREAQSDEARNVLTAALGIDSESLAGEFSFEPRQLLPGDIILLCTDGLHSLVNDEEMAQIASSQSMRDACRELVELAKFRGGPDNITVQLLRLKSVES
jgi:PPM family protein phosphatase